MKRKNEQKRLSWKETLRLNVRAIRLLNRKFPRMLLSRAVCAAWSGVAPFVGIWLSARLIEELSGGRDPMRLAFWAGATILSTAVIMLAQAFLNRWRDTCGAGAWLRLETVFSDKLLKMDFSSLEDANTRDKLSYIQQSKNGGGWGLTYLVFRSDAIVSALFSLLGGISLSLSLFIAPVPEGVKGLAWLNHPLCALAVVAIMLLVTLLAPALQNRANRAWSSSTDEHNLGNRLFGFYGFIGFEAKYAADMRMYGMERICRRHCRDKTSTFGSNGYFAKIMSGEGGLFAAAGAATSVVFTGIAYLYVCLKALGGAFGVGMVAQYVGAITKLAGSVDTLLANAGLLRINAAFLQRTFEFLDLPDTRQTGTLPVRLEKDSACTFEFRDVSFRYPGSENFALRHVNLTFNGGERMAVVGQNGSGKTTFIKLLCRLYEPTEGQILLNGRDVREYDYDEYLAAFAVVFQDFKLFAYPLGQNVAGASSYDVPRTEKSLRDAGFAERLKSFPNGLETCLYKEFEKSGVDVSGGEAQKIALARALYKDAPFIVLDEPTAALDPVAEAEVYANFNAIAGGRTAIYISHRLSSCRFCDDVVVFDNGQLVQRGGHEALLADADGKYSQLWNAQAQYYRENRADAQ